MTLVIKMIKMMISQISPFLPPSLFPPAPPLFLPPTKERHPSHNQNLTNQKQAP